MTFRVRSSIIAECSASRAYDSTLSLDTYVILASLLVLEEIGWYSDTTERVLGLLLHDTVDRDFVSIALGRDEQRRLRAVDISSSLETIAKGRKTLSQMLDEWTGRPENDFYCITRSFMY